MVDGSFLRIHSPFQVAEGSGWKSPKEDSEVRLSLKALNMDGSLIEDKGASAKDRFLSFW